MTARRSLPVLAAALLVVPATALATDVLPGYDLFATVPPDQPPRPASYQDFTGPFTIPPDFFDPGSDPFQGRVYFHGVPLGSFPGCFGDLGNTDTIVEREATAVLPGVGSFDTVPIEIIALSLHSASPITVTYNGGANPELWDVKVDLSPTLPSRGNMTIYHSLPDGGTFDAQFTVYPLLTFTRVSDLSVRILDAGMFGLGDQFSTSNVPWRHDPIGQPVARPSCVSNFVAGYDGNKIDVEELAAYALHGVYPSWPTPTAVEETTWGGLKALYR